MQHTSPILPPVPNFEVKLFLDPVAVLNDRSEPSREVDRVLDLKNSGRKIIMLYLDDRTLSLKQEGWTVRVRRFDGEESVGLTYKRRYPLANMSLDAALATAARDGFDATESDYSAQVEWGHDRRTLTIAREKSFSAGERDGMDLPSADVLRTRAIEKLPGKLDRWQRDGWARAILERGEVHGPVSGWRWKGKWNELGLNLEVWLIRSESGVSFEPIVELSFKTAPEATAAFLREQLMSEVRGRGWLLETDILKTDMILNRHGREPTVTKTS